MTISRMGDSFFPLKCLYPSMDAINMTVMITALQLNSTAKIEPMQFVNTM